MNAKLLITIEVNEQINLGTCEISGNEDLLLSAVVGVMQNDTSYAEFFINVMLVYLQEHPELKEVFETPAQLKFKKVSL